MPEARLRTTKNQINPPFYETFSKIDFFKGWLP